MPQPTMGISSSNQPLRNKTTLAQERHVYEVFRQLCLGQDFEPKHMMRSLKLNADEDKGKAWRNIPALEYEFGLWQYTVKQVYNGFLGRKAAGARQAIIILSITDESLCGLIRRYASQDELKNVFMLPTPWNMCTFYKHNWCPTMIK